MHPESQRFFATLEPGKILLSDLWNILASVVTLEPGKQRETFKFILDELHNALLIEYPKSKQLWDTSALPHLPAWVRKVNPEKHVEHVSGIIWSPELSFLADKRTHTDSHWLVVDAWLKKTRGMRLSKKPVRERSLEIFGDEKVLDKLMATVPFKQALITLDTLGCYYVPEPIPWVPGPIGSEANYGVCVENATTYDTLSRFNKEAGLWGFVAYGRGNGFASMVEGIIAVMNDYGHNKLMYFGDADREGVEIASRGAERLAESGILLKLDTRLYSLLIKTGTAADSKSGGGLSVNAARLVMAAGLGELIDLFRNNKRIAQEWVGVDVLRSLSLTRLCSPCRAAVQP
jgi:hypothetical protein